MRAAWGHAEGAMHGNASPACARGARVRGIGRDRRAISCVHVHDCTGGHCRHRRLHRLGIEPRTRRFRDQPAQPAHALDALARFVPGHPVHDVRRFGRQRDGGERQQLRIVPREPVRGGQQHVGAHERMRGEFEVRQRDDDPPLQAHAFELPVDRAGRLEPRRCRAQLRRVGKLCRRHRAAPRAMGRAHQAHDAIVEQVVVPEPRRAGRAIVDHDVGSPSASARSSSKPSPSGWNTSCASGARSRNSATSFGTNSTFR